MSNFSLSSTSPAHAPKGTVGYFDRYSPELEELSNDGNTPFASKEDLYLGKKQLAMIKNKQAARKYRNKKKSYEEVLIEKLNEMEGKFTNLQLINAGL